MRKRTEAVVLLLLILSGTALLANGAPAANTIESSTMWFQNLAGFTLAPAGAGYTGIVPMMRETTSGGYGDGQDGYDVLAQSGGTAWFGVAGPAWTSLVIGANQDAWATFKPDTPDWYQYSVEFYTEGGQTKWRVRNHPGATIPNPWYSAPTTYPAAGVPLSGLVDWAAGYASETGLGAYLTGTGTRLIPGGAAAHGGGPQAWDMDWSWGSEVVPLQYPGFNVIVDVLPGSNYRVRLIPGPYLGAPLDEFYSYSGAAALPCLNDKAVGGGPTVDVGVTGTGAGTVNLAVFEDPNAAPIGTSPLPDPNAVYVDLLVTGFAGTDYVVITYDYTAGGQYGPVYYWDDSGWQLAEFVAHNPATKQATFRIPVSALTGTVLAIGGPASGEAETDVVDASTAIAVAPITAGSSVCVQTFKISDPGTQGDTYPDGYSTYVETLTVGYTGTLLVADVTTVKLYRDNGDHLYGAGDTLVGSTAGYTDTGAAKRAMFGMPGTLLTTIGDNAEVWFHIVVTFATPVTVAATFTSEVVLATAKDPASGKGSDIDPAVAVPQASGKTFSPSAGASGSVETTVTDHTAGVTVLAGAPGVVLQRFSVHDGGVDAHATVIASVKVRKASGTLDPSKLTNLKLYFDVNGNGEVNGGDVQLAATIATPDLVTGAVFHTLPAALHVVAAAATQAYLLVGDVSATASLGATLTVNVELEARDGMTGGPATSSRFATAMPVSAALPVVVAAPAGDAETDAVDLTAAHTNVVLGQTGVVVQTVKLEDAGGLGDTVEDTFPTRVDQIVVALIDPLGAGRNNRLKDLVASLALYVESDGAAGWTPGDARLGTTVANPDLTAGATFGVDNTELLVVPDGGTKSVYVVAAIEATGGVDGDALWTRVTPNVYQTAGTSSRFDGAALSADAAFPVELQKCVGDKEVDLTDDTKALWVNPGAAKVVIHEFVLEDPGNRGDILDDSYDFRFADVSVRLDGSSTATYADIAALKLYRELDGVPGHTFGDQLIATAASLILDGRKTFDVMSAPWVGPENVKSRERYYVVADFKPDQPVAGRQLRSVVTISPNEGGTPTTHTSCIEDQQPLVATNGVVFGQQQAVVDVHDLPIAPTGSGALLVSVNTDQLADFQVGPVGRLTIANSDKVNVTAVTGVAPYVVGSSSIDDPNTAGAPIEIVFALHLIAGQSPAAGTVLSLTIQGTGVNGDTCAVDITSIDVLRNQVDASIAYSVDPGVITLSGTAPCGGLMGDVNGSGVVDITDARLVAEYSIGLTPLPPFCILSADVNGDGRIDVTDARWIAEAGIGIRPPLSVATRVFGPSSLTQASVSINEFGELIVAGSNADVTDLQGTLYFDPDDVTVTAVGGANGFVVLASAIDNDAGWVKFAAAKLSGGAVGDAPVVLFEATGDVASAVLDVDVLRDKSGQSVPFKTQSSGVGLITEFGCFPNPVQDVHTTYFSAKGTQPIESIRVEIYDFSGALVYDSDWGPNDLAWHVQNDAGDVLANGVYYYRMQVLFVGSDVPVTTKIGKVAVYR
jgi:hypothetical protein